MLPTIQPIKHPRYAFQIVATDPSRREESGRPKRVRFFFKTQPEAEAKLRELGGIVAATGLVGLTLDPATRRDALDARAMLDAAGFTSVSLVEVAQQYIGGQATAPVARELVTPLLDQFLDQKVHEEGASMETRKNLEDRVGRWLDWQAIATVADITPERCIALRSRPGVSAQTRRNDMNAVSSFLTWMVNDAKRLLFNPLHGQRRPKVQRGRPPVYLPATCQQILDAAASYQGGKFARAIGLLFLAGLRPSEVKNALIRTSSTPPIVRVEGGKMRGRANRIVQLSPEGAAWLDQQPPGIELPTTGERRQICKQAGGVKWIQDGARHTWISAKCEIEQNDDAVARMAGTSSEIIYGHYHALMERPHARAILGLGLALPKEKTLRHQP